MKTLIFLTGWACPPPLLRPFLTALAGGDRCERERDRYVVTGDRYRVEALDWANHANYAELVGIRLAELEGQVPLVGWSTGALIALQTARRWPDRIHSLSLIGATACFCQRPDYPHGLPEAPIRTMVRALELSQRAKMLTEFLKQAALPGKLSDDALGDWVDHEDQSEAADLERGLHYLLETDLRDQIGSIACPVLAMHGKRDHIIPAGAGEWICSHAQNAVYKSFNQEGHLLPVVHPLLMADEIIRFLSSDR